MYKPLSGLKLYSNTIEKMNIGLFSKVLISTLYPNGYNYRLCIKILPKPKNYKRCTDNKAAIHLQRVDFYPLHLV